MFRITPKPGTLNLKTELGEVGKPPKRTISFVADVAFPTKIELTGGRRLNLTGDADATPVWVTIWDAAYPVKSVDGSQSYIGLLGEQSQDAVSINISLESAQFEETLRAFRERHRGTFDLSPGSEDHLEYPGKPPPAISLEGRSCINWRDDRKRVIAIRYVTVSMAMASDGPASDVATQPSSDTGSERRTDLSAATEQSILRIEQGVATRLRTVRTQLVWIIVLLAVIAAAALFHR